MDQRGPKKTRGDDGGDEDDGGEDSLHEAFCTKFEDIWVGRVGDGLGLTRRVLVAS